MSWFVERGVDLKTEAEGRIFPVSNRSDTIIHCLTSELQKLGVEQSCEHNIEHISNDSLFRISIGGDAPLSCRSLLLTTGSSREGYDWAASLGHTIIPPVPSLFALRIQSSAVRSLSGVSVPAIEAAIHHFTQRGSLLITHEGVSGPVILKLSSWGARVLAEHQYKASLHINWLPDLSVDAILNALCSWKKANPTKLLASESLFGLPKGLWKLFADPRKANDIPITALRRLAAKLHDDRYAIGGKASAGEEFVTCGGVSCKEVDFRTMESKKCKGLFFAGEILDIDGLTGGFNLQNAWTTGYIAGSSSCARASAQVGR
jgi:hypothetical protein